LGSVGAWVIRSPQRSRTRSGLNQPRAAARSSQEAHAVRLRGRPPDRELSIAVHAPHALAVRVDPVAAEQFAQPLALVNRRALASRCKRKPDCDKRARVHEATHARTKYEITLDCGFTIIVNGPSSAPGRPMLGPQCVTRSFSWSTLRPPPALCLDAALLRSRTIEWVRADAAPPTTSSTVVAGSPCCFRSAQVCSSLRRSLLLCHSRAFDRYCQGTRRSGLVRRQLDRHCASALSQVFIHES
jgi:hypothetical protein